MKVVPIKRGQIWRNDTTNVRVLVKLCDDGEVVFRTLEEDVSKRRTFSEPENWFRSEFTFEPQSQDLDEKWRELVENGHPTVVDLNNRYAYHSEMADQFLESLRLFAEDIFKSEAKK
jgi:hypothetical protein